MDITVTGMTSNACYQLILIGQTQNFRQQRRLMIYRADNVLLADNQAFRTHCFGEGLACLPNFIVLRYQHIAGTVFRADFIHRTSLFIQVILAGAFHFYDKIIALVTALQRCTEITLYGFDSDIIHVFYAGRHNTGHNQLVYRADSILRGFKNRQQIHAVLRQRQQLHCNLRDDTKGTLTADYQLLQAIACSLLLQACSQLHDFAGRIYHLNGIYLMTRSTVFNRAVAAGIGCHIAADKAGITAAGVACIKGSLGRSRSLQIGSTHTRLYNRIHSIGINLDNFIHLFE